MNEIMNEWMNAEIIKYMYTCRIQLCIYNRWYTYIAGIESHQQYDFRCLYVTLQRIYIYTYLCNVMECKGIQSNANGIQWNARECI
jgi:hypothetical protein